MIPNNNNNKNNLDEILTINVIHDNSYQDSILIRNKINNYLSFEIININERTPDFFTLEFFGQDFNSETISINPLNFEISKDEIKSQQSYESKVYKDFEIQTNMKETSQKNIFIPYKYSFNYYTSNNLDLCFASTNIYEKNCPQTINIEESKSPLQITSNLINNYYHDENYFTNEYIIKIKKPKDYKVSSELKNSYKDLDLSDETSGSFFIEFIENNNLKIDCRNYEGLKINKLNEKKYLGSFNYRIDEISFLCEISSEKKVDHFNLPIQLKFEYVYFKTNSLKLFID